MNAKLKDSRYLPTALLFELGEGIDIPRVEHQRLFTDGVGSDSQRKAAVGIVQIVGRTNGDIMHAAGFIGPAQLLQMPVEPFKFGEEFDISEEPIENSDRIARVARPR